MKDPFGPNTRDLVGDLLGDEPAPRRRPGRPQVYTDAAERQRAYRQRLRERGMREISRVVRDARDADEPLRSDVIDLSEVRKR